MHRASLALLLLLTALTPPFAMAGKKTDGLLRVVTPVKGEEASAHPHVNVLVLFGETFDGVAADPDTFSAKLKRQDITNLFEPLAEGEIEGASGLRARLDATLLNVDKGRNKLKLSVRSKPFIKRKREKTVRDKDKVKFFATTGSNTAPEAFAAADTELILQGIAIAFDGTASRDPDLDGLTYTWDFGDGTMSNEAAPVHVFEGINGGDVTVSLTVSDGAESSMSDLVLNAKPAVDDGRTEGLLNVAADGALEFGVVAIGGSATRTITVTNLDPAATSQLKVVAEGTNPAMQLDPSSLDLGASESGEIDVTFSPTAEGHADTRLSIVASAAGRSSVSFVAHGYGGTGAGAGPTLAADPIFYKTIDRTIVDEVTYAIWPDGTSRLIDNSVGGCEAPGFSGTGDACVTDADCAVHGGTCSVSTCIDGANDGQACRFPSDCPDGRCPTGYRLFSEDICGDRHGNLFLLSDDGTFTEPQDRLTERSVTLLRVSFDDQGNVTERKILQRLNEETLDIACDDSASGVLFALEYFDVDSDSCFRTCKQSLMSIRKVNGGKSKLLDRIDSVEGIDNCNDLEDTADALALTPAGVLFTNFQDGGIWRARGGGGPLAFLSNVRDTEVLAAHPDGSLIYASVDDVGTVGFVNLYKISPAQVSTGPLPVGATTPCATVEIPNNGGRTFVLGLAAGPSAAGGTTAQAYVSFQASASGVSGVLDQSLTVRGTATFTVLEGDGGCTPEGFMSLEPYEAVTF